MEHYQQRILRWSASESGNEFIGLGSLIRYLSENLYYDYEPALGAHPEFESRLNRWLNNHTSEEYQKRLLKLVPNIFYLGREEMNSLYHTAFQSNVMRWLFDKVIMPQDTPHTWDKKVKDAINSTWFCPITDSFRINQFYHINGIPSAHELRPDWRSLKAFGSEDKIREYVILKKIKYIILLEDFVGSGNQVFESIKYCVENFDVEVLFVPLIICNQGSDLILGFTHERFTLSPVITLSHSYLVNRSGKTCDDLKDFIEMSEELYDLIMAGKTERQKAEIKVFGFRNTGGVVVMYSNTPNNSLPAIHVESDSWSPLFNRQPRV